MTRSKFLDVWKNCTTLAPVRLVIPDVVRGERLYHMSMAAQQVIESATRSLERLGKISGCATPKAPGYLEAKQGIEKRFDQWVTEIGATVGAIPFAKIDWPKVVSDAVWRVKPFTPASEEKDSEKGFRDYLILETLSEVVETAKHSVVFISNDTLLREAALERLAPKGLAAYEDLTSFASYLKLTHEKVNQEFAQATLQKVPTVFYTPNDPNCVYNKFQIGAAITKEFSSLLNFLIESPKQGGAFASLLGFYSPASEEKIFIDSTELVVADSGVYRWKTKVRFVRLFQKQFPQSAISPVLAQFNETIRIQPFEVSWTAKIDAGASFSDLALLEIKPGAKTTESALVNRMKYGFPQTSTQQPAQPQ